jgi:hypothetical protein
MLSYFRAAAFSTGGSIRKHANESRSGQRIGATGSKKFKPNVFSWSLRLSKLNTEDYPAVAELIDIRGIPTLMMFRQGRKLVDISDATDTANLVRWRSHFESRFRRSR